MNMHILSTAMELIVSADTESSKFGVYVKLEINTYTCTYMYKQYMSQACTYKYS